MFQRLGSFHLLCLFLSIGCLRHCSFLLLDRILWDRVGRMFCFLCGGISSRWCRMLRVLGDSFSTQLDFLFGGDWWTDWFSLDSFLILIFSWSIQSCWLQLFYLFFCRQLERPFMVWFLLFHIDARTQERRVYVCWTILWIVCSD